MAAYKPWNPFTTPKPPSGSYDPALDAALGASNRGLRDIRFDRLQGDSRALADYGTGLGQIAQSRARLGEDAATARGGAERGYNRGVEDLRTGYYRGGQDLDTGYGRDIFDIDKAGSRAQEDFQRNVAALTKGYGNLAASQKAGANQRGVLGGTLMLQSAAKRLGNQAVDQEGLDVGLDRTTADLGTTRERTTEDYGINKGRLGEDFQQGMTRSTEDLDTELTGIGRGLRRGGEDLDFSQAQLGEGYTRGGQDREQAELRAEREATQFGLDTDGQKVLQASQNNWNPATGPSNEFRDASGNPYRVIQRGGMTVGVSPSGTELWKRPKARAA